MDVSAFFPKIIDFLCLECKGHFQLFCSYLDLYGISYEVEPRLVRGLDYYTRTAFEIVSSKLGAQNAILGGGRYDYMSKEFGGPDLCAIGFAVGLERLISVVPFTEEKERFLYLAYMGNESKKRGMEVVRFLRENGVECLLEYKEKSLKKHLSRANTLGAAWVLIIGEDELKQNNYGLKNMETGTQIIVSREGILNHIK